jgi:hypothetical protein
MAITLRAIKETALTYKEMDRNFSSFFYSASQDATTLKLWYTGSNVLNGSGEVYEPRSISINLQASTTPAPVTSISVAGTNDGEIQFKSGDVLGANGEFKYLTATGLLGVGTSIPTARLHVKGNSTYPASIKLESITNEAAHRKSTLEFYQGTLPIGTIGRDNFQNNNIYIKTNQLNSKLVFNIGSSTNESGLTTTGLGIGTIDPKRALHVLGEGYFTTKVSVGEYATTEALNIYNSKQLESISGNYEHIANFSIKPLGSINKIKITAIRTSPGITWETSGMRIQQQVDNISMGYLQFGGTGNNYGISIGTGNNQDAPTGGTIEERLKITAAGAVTINKTLSIGETLTIGSVATAAANNTSAVVVSAAGLIQKIDAAPVPKGGIIMWSGTIATKPAGWHLCDGTNGTPNLTNKFVIGANADDAGVAKTTVTGSASQTGGTKDAVVVSHTHTGTATSSGSHSHLLTVDAARVTMTSQNTIAKGHSTNGNLGYTLEGTNSAPTLGKSSTAEAHSHSLSIDSATEGVSGTNQNLPPFYALAYIMYGGIA